MQSILISLSYRSAALSLRCLRVYHCILYLLQRKLKVSASRWEWFLLNLSITAMANLCIRMQKKGLQKRLTFMLSFAKLGNSLPRNQATSILLWCAKLMTCRQFRQNFSYSESNWPAKPKKGKLIK